MVRPLSGSVGCFAITNFLIGIILRILTLLQKLEDKCSSMSQKVIVKDTRIHAATAFSGATACPLAEETSSPGDNDEGYPELLDTSIAEHSIHVDHVFDEISIGVFTKEAEKTSSASSFLADSEAIQSSKVLNTFFHGCCPKAIAEVQPETPIKMIDVEAPCPEHSTVHLFDKYFPLDMSKRYITTLSLDHGSSKQQIEFETFNDMYLPEFLLEPETYLNPDRFLLKIEAKILPSNMPSYEMLLVVKHGKSTDEFNAYKILPQFLFDPRGNSSIVSVHGTSMYLSVWDPGVCLNSVAPTGYTNTMNVDPLQLLGSSTMCCFIPYAPSTTQVWDPGRQLSWKSYIVGITENRIVGVEINGVSLTIIEGNNAKSQKEGSQSSRDVEDDLLVPLYVTFEKRRVQLASQLTETSQDQLGVFFTPAWTTPIHHFGLLVDVFIMLGSRCTIGEIVGVVMHGKIAYFFGTGGALCSFGWLAIIFDRNVSWFDIGSVLIYCGRSLVVQIFSLFFIQVSPTWLTKATHWKACITFLRHLQRNTANCPQHILQL